ncbi:MAG: DegV family protein [Clostridia bacterium]|nr:DegV family protein [Clostridia bacterium]
MSNFAIMADATCDLTKELSEKYDIITVPGHLVFPGNKEIKAFLDWETVPRDEFYADLKKKPDEYSTSPANVEEFAEAMGKPASEGKDIILMTISAGMSGAYNFALQAKDIVEKKYGVNIKIIDSMRFGPGFGLMAIHASLQRAQGKSMEEVAAWIEENKNRFHQAGWLDDLSFVAKRGRLTHAKAFFGALAGVKPIGEFDYNGMTTVIGKAKGAKKAYAALLSYIEGTIEDPQDQIIFIAQTNRLPQAEEYKKLIEERIHPKEIYVKDVFPSCGINVGPGLMAAYYVGKPISKDLSFEKELLNKYLEAKE